MLAHGSGLGARLGGAALSWEPVEGARSFEPVELHGWHWQGSEELSMEGAVGWMGGTRL